MRLAFLIITALIVNNVTAFVPDPLDDRFVSDYFYDVGINTVVTQFSTFNRTLVYGIDSIVPTELYDDSKSWINIIPTYGISIANRPNSNTTVKMIYDYPEDNYPVINTDIHIRVTKQWYDVGLVMWINFTTSDDETFEYVVNDFSQYTRVKGPLPTGHVLSLFLHGKTYVIKQYIFGFSNTFYVPTVAINYPTVLITYTSMLFVQDSTIEERRSTNYLYQRETEVIPYTKYGNLAVDEYMNTGFEITDNSVTRRFIVRFPPKKFTQSPKLTWKPTSFSPSKKQTVEFGYLTGDGTFVRLAIWRKAKAVNTLPLRKVKNLELDNFCLIITGAGTLLDFSAN